WRARHRSWPACISIHISALVPSAASSRNAISALMPARPLSKADSACLVTPRRLAASVTPSDSGKYSRSTSPGCAWLCMRVICKSLSVIIQVIDQFGILVFKTENQSPVAVDSDREKTFQVATQLVQAPAGRIQITGIFCVIQCRQHDAQ